MTPDIQARGKGPVPVNNVYTIIIGLTLLVVLATTAFVVYTCHAQYGKIFFDLF
ncbi:MAG TPA: hypothetical protein PLP05_01020 [Sedimentisphaerales bacterium]|nr:hypothetical protein [Sedimentisphaerales bacterium]